MSTKPSARISGLQKPQSVNEKTASMSNKPSTRLTGTPQPQQGTEKAASMTNKPSARLTGPQQPQQGTEKAASMGNKPSARLTGPPQPQQAVSMSNKPSARLTGPQQPQQATEKAASMTNKPSARLTGPQQPQQVASMSNKPSARLTGPQQPQQVTEKAASMTNKPSARLTGPQQPQRVTEKAASMGNKPSARLTGPQQVTEKAASMTNKPSARLTGPQHSRHVTETKLSAKFATPLQQAGEKLTSMGNKPSARLTGIQHSRQMTEAKFSAKFATPLQHAGERLTSTGNKLSARFTGLGDEKPASMSHKHSARLTGLQHSLHVEKSDTNMGSVIHYMSPASVTMTTLHPEDYGSLYDYYQYLQVPPGSYSGEFKAYSYYSSKSSSIELHRLERTCAIIRPDAVYFEDVVIRKILQQGFHILQRRKIHLTPEQVSELYTQYYGTASFPFLVVSMSSGPVIVLCLACTDAVTKWRQLVRGTGTINCNWFLPKALRVRFGRHGNMDNVLHASEDIDNADREVRFFFPQMILEPLLSTEPEVTDYLAIYVNPTLLNALVELCKKKPLEPLLFFAEWLLQNNPYQPKMKPEIARLPT